MVIVKIRTGSGGWETATTQVCTTCGDEKPLREFSKSRGYKYDRTRKCNLCKRKYDYKYRKENKQQRTEYHRKWVKANPEKIKARNSRRRALKLNAAGDFTGNEFKELCEYYHSTCLCCGRDDVKLTADHIVPLSGGGSNDIDNIQPLCVSCNCSKGTKTIDYRKALVING